MRKMESSYSQLTPAQSLAELTKTLLPDPLVTHAELKAFYLPDLNPIRGQHRLAKLRTQLELAKDAVFFRQFLVGNRGVGKSTELSQLVDSLGDQFHTVRFSVAAELDAHNFKVFDVLVLIVLKTAAEVGDQVGSFHALKEAVEKVLRWMGKETSTSTTKTEGSAQVAVGIDSKQAWTSWITGMFVEAKAEMRFASERKEDFVRFRLQRVSELTGHINTVLDICRATLRSQNKDLLILGEDFDKDAVSEKMVIDTFVDHGALFRDLRVHQIYTLPRDLLSSRYEGRLPMAYTEIPDTPVFERSAQDGKTTYQPFAAGRQALRNILAARMNLELAEPAALEALITGSGGNVRMLFSLVRDAGLNAMSETRDLLSRDDAKLALQAERARFATRLGSAQRFEDQPVSREQKFDRLAEIHSQESGCNIPDDVTHTLVSSGAVQYFNHDGWYGVHPLVVDLLCAVRPVNPARTGCARLA